LEKIQLRLNFQKKKQWSEGQYVRVIGLLRSFQNRRTIMAFRTLPVEDSNELTYHLLEVIYVHLYNLRGPLEGAAPMIRNQPQQMMPNTHPNYQYNNAHNANFGGNQGGAPGNFPYGGTIHEQVLQVLNSIPASQQGISVQYIAQQLQVNINDLLKSVEFLCAEGHLYSTVDDEHVQLTTRMN